MSYRNKVQLCECEICHIIAEPGVLEVHHIDENHKNNAESNLCVLCGSCHNIIHKNEIINLRWVMTTKGRELIFETNPTPIHLSKSI